MVKGTQHVEIERLAFGARLLGAVEHRDALHGFGRSLTDGIDKERTEEVYGNHSHLASLLHQEVDGLTRCLCCGTHEHDNLFSLGVAIVIEQMIVSTGNPVDFTQIVLHYLRHAAVIAV